MTKTVSVIFAGLMMVCSAARGQDVAPPDTLATTFEIAALEQLPLQLPATQAPPVTQSPAFVYTRAYDVRARIHEIASIATLPLFGADLIVAQSLYNSPGDGKKTAHVALSAGIGGLFGLNTATGVWNLIEARKDPHKRGLRLTHGLMMLGADGGFLVTGLMTPNSEHGNGTNNKAAHRAVAISSMGLATASYLIMLVKN
jgi:hypothetical protein